MKLHIAFLLACMSTSPALVAQETVAPVAAPQTMSRADAQREKMIATLGLSAEQITALDEIYARNAAAAKELNRSNGDPEQKRKDAVAMRDRREAEIKAMLTPEQNVKYAGMSAEERSSGAQRHKDLKAKPHQE